MKLNDAGLQGLHQAQTRRPAEQPAACPPAEELVAFVCGAPDLGTRERLADHLIGCSDCAQEVRLLQSLSAPAEALVIEQVPALAAIPAAPRRADTRGRRWFVPSRFVARLPRAVAASLLVATALGVAALALSRESTALRRELAGRDQALTETRQQLAGAVQRQTESEARIAALRHDLDALAQPQLNVPIVDLDPGDAFRGAPERRRKTIEVPAGTGLVTLILNVVGDPRHAGYGLEIVDPAGRIAWSGQGLEKSALNTFTVAIPRQVIGSGPYRIKLYGLGAGRTLIEDYAVQFAIR